MSSNFVPDGPTAAGVLHQAGRQLGTARQAAGGPRAELYALRLVREVRGLIDQAETLLVRDARDGGASWELIGEATGYGHSAAHRRWSTSQPQPAGAAPGRGDAA